MIVIEDDIDINGSDRIELGDTLQQVSARHRPCSPDVLDEDGLLPMTEHYTHYATCCRLSNQVYAAQPSSGCLCGTK